MNKNLEKSKLFYSLTAFTVIGFCTFFISFVSPAWIESVPDAQSQFQRIGLWTACFNGYMLPGQYDKAYFGCYYIYFVVYDRVRYWINPTWLYSIQVLTSCGILVQSIVVFMILSQVTRAVSRSDLNIIKFILTGQFFTCITLSSALVAFAVARYDSRWMPYPQYNILSWGYIIGVISFVCNLIGFILTFVYYVYLDSIIYDNNNNHDDKLIDNEQEIGLSSPPLIQNEPIQSNLMSDLKNPSSQFWNDMNRSTLPTNQSNRPESSHQSYRY